MEITYLVIALGTVGLLASFASGMAAGLKFLLVYVLGVAIAGWVLSVLARRQLDIVVDASRQAVVAVVKDSFSGVGWKSVNGPGEFNFQARGLGFGAYNAKRPVISVDVEDHADGAALVNIWTSAWSSQFGMMALCDRVITKRFRLGRKLAELSSATHAPLDAGYELSKRKSTSGIADPVRPAHLAGDAGASSPSDDKTRTLPNPGLPEGNPTQISYELLKACGLSLVSYGRLPLDQHVSLLLERIPLFRDTVASPLCAGHLAGRDDAIWTAYDGTSGSAIVFFAVGAASDVDFVQHSVLKPMATLPPPLQFGIGTVGARLPGGAVDILVDARVVPLWELAPFADQRPADVLPVPAELKADLLRDGWEAISADGLKLTVPVDPSRTLSVFFSPHDAESFALMTPIDKYALVPPEVRARSFGDYEMDAIDDMAVMCRRYPVAQPLPTAAALRADAVDLASYVHQQFSAIQPVSAPTSPEVDPVEFRRTKVLQLQDLLDACADGRLDVGGQVDEILIRLRELYYFAPDMRGLVEKVGEIATRNSIADWAENGGDLTNGPWSKIKDGTEGLLAEQPTYHRTPPQETALPPTPAARAFEQPAPNPQPHQGSPRPAPAATPRIRSPRPKVLAVVAVTVVLLGIVGFAVRQHDAAPPTTAHSASSQPSTIDVRDIAPCSVPPQLKPGSAVVTTEGLTVATQIEAGCSAGDVITNDNLRVTAVDSQGRDVASGLFDFSQNPIAISAEGGRAELVFPAGLYWREGESISGPLQLNVHKDGNDHPTTTHSISTSAHVTASRAGAPEGGTIDAAAESALADLAAADRIHIDTSLLNVWQPQLSAKRPGLVADDITWSAPEILREHMDLRQRFPTAQLVWSGDWPVFSDPTWWVTVAGLPFESGEQANNWCSQRGFDADHCFAKVLSHDMGPSGTTLGRK